MAIESRPPTHRQPLDERAVLVMSTSVVLVAMMAAAVLLGLAGWAPEAIGGVLTAIGVVAGVVIKAMGKLAEVDRKQDEQQRSLATITAQTNGILDSRIREGVRAALAEALNSTPAPSATVDT